MIMLAKSVCCSIARGIHWGVFLLLRSDNPYSLHGTCHCRSYHLVFNVLAGMLLFVIATYWYYLNIFVSLVHARR